MSVSVLHLIELTGRATPLFIAHKKNRTSSKWSNSEPIVKAFRHYESCQHDRVSLHPFTLITSYPTMHEDICAVALDMRTNLIVIPFHKKYISHGEAAATSKKHFRTLNKNVLEKSPCSVAILVDKGMICGSRQMLSSWPSFRIAVMFLGGCDDREALAVGMRAATDHENVHLTMIRLVENGNVSSDDLVDKKLDNAMLSEFRESVAGNSKVKYVEEVVMDGSGTMGVVRTMEEEYELIVVGHRHDEHSQLMMGLTNWMENSELGTIGDILASADFRGGATILVVQQQFEIGEFNANDQRGVVQNVDPDEAEDVPITNKHSIRR